MHTQTSPLNRQSARPSRRANRSRKLFLSLTTLVALGLAAGTPVAHAGNTWTGGGISSNWSDNNNWGGSQPGYGTLTFNTSGNGYTMADDNITSMNQLFWTGSNSWTLNQGGSTILSLFDNGGTQAKVENQSTGLVTINLPLTFAATTGANWGEINAVNGDLTFGSGTLTVNGSGVNGIKLFGSSHSTTFNNTVNASGKWFGLTGANTTMAIGGSFTSGDIYVMNGGTLNLNQSGNLTTSAIRLGGDFGNTGSQNQALGGTLALASVTGGQNFSGLINSVSSNTSGSLLISSLNTSNTNTLLGGIYLDSNLNTKVAAGGTLALTGSTLDLKNHQLTVTGSGNTNVTTIIQNTTLGGSIVKQDSGTLSLTASNTYTGSTTINGGTLSVSTLVNGNLASGIGKSLNSASNLLLNGGALQFMGTNASSNGVTDRLFTLGPSGGTLDASGVGTLTFNGNGTGSANAIAYSSGTTTTSLTLTGNNLYGNTFKPLLTNNNGVQASLTKTGVGAWFLTNSNTYTGGTTVNGGTLTVTGSIGSGKLEVDNTNTGVGTNVLIVFNASQTVNSLSGTVSQTGVTSGTNTAQINIGDDQSLNVNQSGTTNFAGSVTGPKAYLNIYGQGTGGSSALINYTGTDSVGKGNSGLTTVGTNATLQLNNPSGSALAGPVAVATGGTVSLATDNQIATDTATGAPATHVALNGGTLNANGHSDGTLNADGTVALAMGSLTLGPDAGTTSLLDFGANQGNGPVVMAFANSSTTLGSGHLNVVNYVGGVDSLYIGTSNTAGNGGLTPTQLSQITFNGFSAMQLGNGQITFAPEPSETVALLGGAGLLGGLIAFRRRMSRATAKG